MEYMDHPYKEIPYHKHQKWYGYFQTEKYFKDQRDKLIDLFKPTEEQSTYIYNKYKNLLSSNCVSLHIRRGDYVHLKHLHPLLSSEYYTKALDLLKPFDNVLVFSDDISWCKENFDKSYEFISEDDCIELYLMSQCTNNIIANSSFSW